MRHLRFAGAVALRTYSFHATDDTIDALAMLRGPWAGYATTDGSLTVQLANGAAVRIAVEGEEFEPELAAFRLSASVVAPIPEVAGATTDFGAGRNQLVIFQGETWLARPAIPLPTELGDRARLRFSGGTGTCPPSADVVCSTTDALVIATPLGTGLLARIGGEPYTLEIVEDQALIAQFLHERGFEPRS